METIPSQVDYLIRESRNVKLPMGVREMYRDRLRAIRDHIDNALLQAIQEDVTNDFNKRRDHNRHTLRGKK